MPKTMKQHLGPLALGMILLGAGGCEPTPPWQRYPPQCLALGYPCGQAPGCQVGEALSTDSSGNIICKRLPDNVIALPICDPTTEALTSTHYGVSCTQRNGGAEDASIAKRVTDVETKINDLGTRIDRLGTPGSGGGGFKSFKGLSAKTFTGHIKLRSEGDVGVSDNGLLAASRVCEQDHGAGARICTVGDLVNSAINGKLVRTALMTETAWIYNHTFRNPLNARVAGLSDNCAAYSYETADAAWQGTAFQWRLADTPVAGKGDVSPNFYLVGCNTSRKIACCK
jgi:hypothetical protein